MAAPITGSNATGGNSSGGKVGIVLALAFAVFFLLGGVTNINDLLVGKFKPMFDLSHTQANFVQLFFFFAYAAFSIPAGIILSKLGYIRTFVLGFVIIAAAAFLFIPASAAASFPGFLAALFCIGAGITVLQVAMNPVIKFTTLFGLLAVELAIEMPRSTTLVLSAVFFAVSMVFVWRSFYGMRIGGTESFAAAKKEAASVA